MTDAATTADFNDFIDVMNLLLFGPTEKTAENDFPTFVKDVESLAFDLKEMIIDEPLHVATAALGAVLADTLKKWPKHHQTSTVSDIVEMLYEAIGAEIEIHVGVGGKEVAAA